VTDRPPIRAVLFDWDGTLLDSFRADAYAYRKAFHALGINWGLSDLARHYHPDWYRVYRAARLPRPRWEEANRLWRRYYRECRPRLLPGARRVLRRLGRSYSLGLVTSGNRRRVRRQLRAFGLARVFAVCVFHEDSRQRKPHPGPLRVALRRLRLPPAACVYVGDAPEDVEMARCAGLRVIGVFGPYPTHHRLKAARPDALLERIADLPALLERWRRLTEKREAF
jgi:HAD superfamily hydrolase (TIGR01509 family)